jgi:hypothetical protein
MTFREEVKTELHELCDLGVCSKKKSLQACQVVDSLEDFTEDNCMSVSEAASLALELV